MRYRVDTNLLVRQVDPTDLLHAAARTALLKLRHRGDALCVTSQNYVEFWCTATKTGRNGLSMPLPRAADWLDDFDLRFTMLPDSPRVFTEWRRLVTLLGVQGGQVFDTRLAAFCHVYAVPRILTFNTRDFTRFVPFGLTPTDPHAV